MQPFLCQVAKESGCRFVLTDLEAVAVMRRPCAICGVAAPEVGHGITRLGHVDQSGSSTVRVRVRIRVELSVCSLLAGNSSPFPTGDRNMGPYTEENTAPACTICNMGKGCHSIAAFIDICRHIAPHRGLGAFGLYPDRFRNNISKRSRSSYTSESKTHALTNEQFDAIVAQPCYYCGKKSDPPTHYNGLDRLDSTVRVYNATSCVSCCGT